MEDGVQRALEFDRIREAVQSFALTPLGAEALATLQPQTDLNRVRVALDTTTEGTRYLDTNAPFALNAPRDLKATLTLLAVEGQPLEPKQLIGLADYLASVKAVKKAVEQADSGPYPSLRTILDDCRSFEPEVAEIHSKLDLNEGVVDNASTELKSIRQRLRKQRQQLRKILDSFVRGKDTVRYLQEQVITERNGRLVLIVKSEHRSAIPGIVHGSSSTRASLFLEPLSTVDINNDIVALEQDEAKEIHSILVGLANALRKRALDVRATLEAATEIDVVQARATFSRLIDGVAPDLTNDLGIELVRARHPLLIPAVQRRLGTAVDASAGGPVPVDIRISSPITVLIITGPNTGGKTVALKTAGLLTLMVQAGLHIPADARSRTTVFRSVFADIGDEQSIATSLSTFSGHIANIVSMEEQLRNPGLVLLDEIGAGTDPIEGGALGASVIEHFRQRSAIVMATTHDDTLKSYASTTEGVECAGFGFDAETFAPTFQLTYGSPGRSLALEIAARLGLVTSIVDSARQRLGKREAQLTNHLAKVDADLRQLESDRQKLQHDRSTLTADREALAAQQQKLDTHETRTRKSLEQRVDAQVRTARTEIDAIINDLRTRAAQLEQSSADRARMGQPGLSTGHTGTLRAEARAAVDAAVKRDRTTEPLTDEASRDGASPLENRKPTHRPEPPAIGVFVRIRPLGVVGRVLARHNEHAEVDVRGKRIHVPVSDLQVEHTIAPGHQTPRSGRVTVAISQPDGPLPDLNVVGYAMDEARERVEKHLDRAVLQEQRHVRIIHGHGAGRLRRSIADLLERHPQVERFTLAPPEQGGGGATLVELKE